MGSPGRKAVAAVLPLLRERCGGFDFVIANCENAAAGKGITRKIADELFGLGIDGMTSGNHIWDKPEGVAVLEEDHRIIRPANYPDECPGQGMAVLEKNGGNRTRAAEELGISRRTLHRKLREYTAEGCGEGESKGGR